MSIGQQIINGTYGLDNRPLTAYEELKAWCEKYLGDKYTITVVPETTVWYKTLYTIKNEEIFYFSFDTEGYFIGMGGATIDEMNEHILDYELERKTSP